MSQVMTPAAISDERELRAAIAELLDALLELHFLTTPQYGGSVVGGGVSGGSDLGRESVPRALDPARSIWRSLERYQIRRVREQAASIRRRCRGEEIQGPRSWRCQGAGERTGCGRFNPGTNRCCGGCGMKRPEETERGDRHGKGETK